MTVFDVVYRAARLVARVWCGPDPRCADPLHADVYQAGDGSWRCRSCGLEIT